jgi:ketosteroid isomerase-like protein
LDETTARRTVERYLHAVDAQDIDEMLRCFSEDVFYSHPPYATDPAGAPRYEVNDKEGLRALLTRRGKRSVLHTIDALACSGQECFVAGRGGDPKAPATWLAQITMDPDGVITRYAVYTSLPGVGAASAVAAEFNATAEV